MSYNFKEHENCDWRRCRNKRYAKVQRIGHSTQLWVCKTHVHPNDQIQTYWTG